MNTPKIEVFIFAPDDPKIGEALTDLSAVASITTFSTSEALMMTIDASHVDAIVYDGAEDIRVLRTIMDIRSGTPIIGLSSNENDYRVLTDLISQTNIVTRWFGTTGYDNLVERIQQIATDKANDIMAGNEFRSG